MFKNAIRVAGQAGLFLAAIVFTGVPVLAQKSVWEKGAELQLVSEIGAGEGPAWNPEIGLVSSFGSVYVHDVENPNRGEPKVYLKDLGTNGLLWDAQGRLLCCQPSKQRVIRIENDGTARHTMVICIDLKEMKWLRNSKSSEKVSFCL